MSARSPASPHCPVCTCENDHDSVTLKMDDGRTDISGMRQTLAQKRDPLIAPPSRYRMDPVIFREYDIRGVVGRDFDADFAYALGRAYVAYIGTEAGIAEPTIALGHDPRETSPELADA